MYKVATLKFHNWMAQEACPNDKMSAIDDYRNGVQRLLDHNRKVYLKNEQENRGFIVAPPEIMASLALSIRLREKVTATLFGSKGGGGLGHLYIIDVLRYCRSALIFVNRMAASIYNVKEENENVQKAIGGRFNALTLDHGEDDEEEMDWDDIDRDIKEGNVPKYSGVEVEEEIDINEILVNGDDRFQAMALLNTMEDLMGTIRQHYTQLKDFMRGNAENHEPSQCIQLVMKCAAVANTAIDSVNRAEIELEIDHPHLSSFYHVLALVFFTECIADLTKLIEKAKLVKDPHMPLQFVAKLIECAFLYKDRALSKLPSTVKWFVKKSGLEPQYVVETANDILNYTQSEIITHVEMMRRGVLDAAKVDGHTWLSRCEFIGGDCCILNTQKLVQEITNALDNNKGPRGAPGFWGPPFDENLSPARRILGDLDDPFACCILPEIWNTCNLEPFDKLPDRSYLITLLDLFKRHITGDKTKPVPIALSFGFHAVLMSLFTLQGDGDLARIAAATKQSYYTLIEQLQTVSDRNISPENTPHFYEQVPKFVGLAWLAAPCQPRFGLPEEPLNRLKAEMLAFWNPLIGGEYMLYATYACGIRLGSETVDSVSQLRSALHLYNGLRLRDPTLNIPFLTNMDTVFENTKLIWNGVKPEKGSCCKAFYMSWWGMNSRRADDLSCKHAARMDTTFVGYMIMSEDLRR